MALGERVDGGQKKDGERGHEPMNVCVCPLEAGKGRGHFLSRAFKGSTPLLAPCFSPVRLKWDF